MALGLLWGGLALAEGGRLPLAGCGVEAFPEIVSPQPVLPGHLKAALSPSRGTDPDAPAGAVNPKLNPLQKFSIECYIGAAVEGGYAKNLYEGTEPIQRKRTNYDEVASVRTKDGELIAPRYYIIKEELGPELARTRNDGYRGFAATFERALENLKNNSDTAAPSRWAKLLAARLSPKILDNLKSQKIDPVAAVGNFLAIRSAMRPVEGNLVRGVTGGELGLEKGTMPEIGSAIPFSSSKGTAISTNPVESLKDTVDYVTGKVNTTHPRHGGKDAYVLVYPPETVEGVSIKSLGDHTVDGIESHLAVNIGPDGKEYRDPAVVVSKREVIASPKEDLVVSGLYRTRKNPSLIYVVMGKKGAVPLGEHWED